MKIRRGISRLLVVLMTISMLCPTLTMEIATADVSGTVLDLSQNDITITSSGNYLVSSIDTSHTITIDENVTCNLTINNLSIKADDSSAILVKSGAVLNLAVTGTNILTGGKGYAAICIEPAYGADWNYVPDKSAVLNISGAGTLNAYGGSGDVNGGTYGGGAGIGGNGEHQDGGADVDFGNIIISENFTGTINAVGGVASGVISYDNAFGGGAGIGSGGFSMGYDDNYDTCDYYWQEVRGQIFIKSGTINANVGHNEKTVGAGIGGGSASGMNAIDTALSYITVDISGGDITAYGGICGAGIGGGGLCDGGEITIRGGNITANAGATDSSLGGAGIGGGNNASVTKVIITGGVVTAAGNGGGAGIGGGSDTTYSERHYWDTNGNITEKGLINISGEDTYITAYGGTGTASKTGKTFGGAGIGSGCPIANNNRSVAFDIFISSGATVNAFGGYHAQAIGYGYWPQSSTSSSPYYTGYGITLELDDTINLWAVNADYFQPALAAATAYNSSPVSYSSDNEVYLIEYTDADVDTTAVTSYIAEGNLTVPGSLAKNIEWEFLSKTMSLTIDGIIKRLNTPFTELKGNWATLSAAGIQEPEKNVTIDPSKEVTLTIHKYVYNDRLDYEGTGLSDDSAHVPEGAEPLKGVGFSVWKIADITQATANGVTGIEYYVTNDSVPATYIDANGYLQDYITNSLSTAAAKAIYDAVKDTDAAAIGTTDENGEYTFNGLGQGLYLVAETTVPDGKAGAVPFLVSLPTTVITVGTTVTSEWLYDVHAYPKNTNNLSLVVYKYGKTAGQNEETAGVLTPLSDAEFYLQKKTESDWETVTQESGGSQNGNNDEAVIYKTGRDGAVTIENLTTGEYRLVEKAASGYIVKSNETYEFTVKSDGKIVRSDGITEITGITVINERPTIEKKVLSKDGDTDTVSDWKDVQDYSVGDTVPFKITVTIPDNIEKLQKYIITDSFDENVFDVDDTSFTYKYYDKDGNDVDNPAGTDDEINITPEYGEGSWSIDLVDAAQKLAKNKAAKIEITYNAILKSGAVTADAGNMNSVKLDYTSQIYDLTDKQNPTTPDEGDPVIPEDTVTDSAIVLTFGIQLDKLFDGKKVTDGDKKATFVLYREADAGESGATTIGGVEESVKLIGTYTTDDNGQILLNTAQTGDNKTGFSNGKYYFVETTASKGYNLLAAPVKVEVEVYYAVKDGVVTYFDADDVTITDTTTKVTVNNKKGFTFPFTGSRGIIMFTVIGILLMLVAVSVFYVSKNRKTVDIS